MTTKNVVTSYELQSLIERCFAECKEANFIAANLETKQTILLNEGEVINHIANTIIGELHELEMIRRIAPMFREVRRLEGDFNMLDDKEQQRINLAGLRIAKS